MRSIIIVSIFLFCSMSFNSLMSQSCALDTVQYKHHVGSTMFILMTPLLDPSPKYFQLNYGHRLTPRDVLSVEAITWSYLGPIGRAYGSDFENPESDFPGEIRAYGLGLAYKRFVWKSAFVQIHSTAFRQHFLDDESKTIQTGFQLFNTCRIGYQFRLFKGRFFIEPSIAATYWPINTNLPQGFQEKEDLFSNYFLFEPGLHFGFNF